MRKIKARGKMKKIHAVIACHARKKNKCPHG